MNGSLLETQDYTGPGGNREPGVRLVGTGVSDSGVVRLTNDREVVWFDEKWVRRGGPEWNWTY